MIYVEKRQSKDKNYPYYALVVDLGYAERVLTFDKTLIAEILDISFRELQAIEGRVNVGEIKYNKEV